MRTVWLVLEGNEWKNKWWSLKPWLVVFLSLATSWEFMVRFPGCVVRLYMGNPLSLLLLLLFSYIFFVFPLLFCCFSIKVPQNHQEKPFLMCCLKPKTINHLHYPSPCCFLLWNPKTPYSRPCGYLVVLSFSVYIWKPKSRSFKPCNRSNPEVLYCLRLKS